MELVGRIIQQHETTIEGIYNMYDVLLYQYVIKVVKLSSQDVQEDI